MGSVGNTAVPATKYNDYGFEIENSNSPEIEFTDRVWKEMSDLQSYGAFRDSELAGRVDARISDLVSQYGDLEAYDSDLTTLREKIENSGVTDDEYWAAYHVMANMLGIKPNRYTVWDSDMTPWDERFSSTEQAEHWAGEREGAKYLYDTWTRKYRKIGGKNWRQ